MSRSITKEESVALCLEEVAKSDETVLECFALYKDDKRSLLWTLMHCVLLLQNQKKYMYSAIKEMTQELSKQQTRTGHVVN